MNRIEKLLRKISKGDRERLLNVTERLMHGETAGLDIKKIVGTDLSRLRSGRFRIIFHLEGEEPVIDSVKLRNEATYRRI